MNDCLKAFRSCLRRGACVNAHSTDMLVACQSCRDAIDEAAFLTHFDEETRGHISTEYLTYYQAGIVIGVDIVGEWEHQGKVFLLPFLVFQCYACGRLWPLFRRGSRRSGPVAKQNLHLFYDTIPIELSGDSKKRVIGLIARLPKISHVLALQRLYTF